jgi:hypothetical protein
MRERADVILSIEYTERTKEINKMVKQVSVTDELRTTCISTREAEKLAGVSKGYLNYRRGASMTPPYLRRGRSILYRKDEILAWIKDWKLFTEIPAVCK